MQFVYKPEGVEPKKWEFDPMRLMSPEAEAIERLTKMTFGEWCEAVDRGSVVALHGLLYVMLKRENPTLKYEQVEFSLSEVSLEFTDAEVAAQIAALEASAEKGELSETDAAILESLREQAAESDEDEAPKED